MLGNLLIVGLSIIKMVVIFGLCAIVLFAILFSTTKLTGKNDWLKNLIVKIKEV